METEKVESQINDKAGCCDSPEIDVVDLSFKFDSKNGVFRSDVICRNCWEANSVKIGLLDVKFTR